MDQATGHSKFRHSSLDALILAPEYDIQVKDIRHGEEFSLDTVISKREHNAALPIHSSPAEIFLEILFLSIDFSAHEQLLISQLHALAQVCAHWSYSIRGGSRFWRVVDMDEWEWARTVVRKNPHGPLNLRCVQVDMVGAESASEFLKFARDHAHRWEKLTMNTVLGIDAVRRLEVQAPLLKYLQLRGKNTPSGVVRISAPALQHVDVFQVYFDWNSPSLTGLRYLNICELSEGLPSLSQLFNILQASPELEWFGVQHLYPRNEERYREEILEEPTAPVSLRALRDIALCPPLEYLTGKIDAPNCRMFYGFLSFDELIRPGSTAPKLARIPAQAEEAHMTADLWHSASTMTITSPLGRSDWSSSARQPGGFVSIDNVPYGTGAWTLLFHHLGLSVETTTVPVGLQLTSALPIFSGNDIAFWRSTTTITFRHTYPHILLVLRYLSEPTVVGGVISWCCPRLTSLIFNRPWSKDRWNEESSIEALVEGIFELVSRRLVLPTALVGNWDDSVPAPLTHISGTRHVVEQLRGRVPEGLYLCYVG